MSDQPSTLQPYFLPKLGLIYALAGQQRQEYCKMLSTAARTLLLLPGTGRMSCLVQRTAARNKTEFHLHNYTPLNYHYAGTGVEENNHFKQFLPMQCSVCFISNLRRDIFSCLCLKDICCHWN